MRKRPRRKPRPTRNAKRPVKRSRRASASSSRKARPPYPFPTARDVARIEDLLAAGSRICSELSGLLARAGAAQRDLGGPGWTAMNHIANAAQAFAHAQHWQHDGADW